MISNVNEIDYCKLKITAQLEAEIVADKRADVLLKLKQNKQLKIPGFRPGKATVQAIKHNLLNQIEDTLKQELAQKVFSDVIAEHSISPFGYPEFSKMVLDEKGFSCEFFLLQKPKLELAEYKGFKLPKFYHEKSVEELSQQMLQDLRVKYGTSSVFEENDTVQEGDSIIVSYSAKNELGEDLPELKADGEMMTAGKSLVVGFDNNIYGMKIGEKRDFIIKAPETSKFANQNITFSLHLLMGSKNTPASLNDEFAKKLGLNSFNDLLGFTTNLSSNNLKKKEDQYYLDQVARRLVDNHKIKVPSWISSYEAQYIVKSQKLDWEKLSDEQKLEYVEAAENNIILSLVLEKVREVEIDAQLSDEETFNIVKTNFQKSAKSQEELTTIFKNIQEAGQLPMLFARARDEYTLTFIKNNSEIVE